MLSIIWWWLVDKVAPDKFDLLGALIGALINSNKPFSRLKRNNCNLKYPIKFEANLANFWA
jgi:hypothetical protein